MPISSSFPIWFRLLCEWSRDKELAKLYGPLETDLLFNFKDDTAPFRSILDSQRLKAYPILTGMRYEIVEAILTYLDDLENADRPSYPEIARILLHWHSIPLLVLGNADVPNPTPNRVSLLIDVAALATRVYMPPETIQNQISKKRWQAIGAFLVFLGFSSLLQSNDRAAS